MSSCTHLDEVRLLEPNDPVAGREECPPRIADGWVRLRMCTSWAIRCSDLLPNRHAGPHAHKPGHRFARHADQVMLRLSAA